MEDFKEIEYMLELIDRPAFCVRNEIISAVNTAAAGISLEPGRSVSDMLGDSLEEFRNMPQGVLYLTLHLGDASTPASVKRMEHGDVFVLEYEATQDQVRTMALAAMQLRNPLAEIMATLSVILPKQEHNENARSYRAALDRSLFRMHRLICNMSDVERYAQEEQPAWSCQDMSTIAEGLFRKAESLAREKRIAVVWECPKEQAFTMVDYEKVERAFYNMLSNALKYTPEGGKIQLGLHRTGDRLYLVVRDWGEGISGMGQGSVFNRFRRQPGLEDSRHGLGVGFSIICAAATAHGGTVLVDSPEGGGFRVTMSLMIRRDMETVLRSGLPLFDYAGGKNHALLELADALPESVWGSLNEFAE